jgi:hypothetical protein
MPTIRLTAALLLLLVGSARAGDAVTYRLYQGVNLYVNNPTGEAFDVNVALRDLNLFSKGPREVLFKITDPEGKTPVRRIIEDDGVPGKGFLPRLGGWDHEIWYYTLCYSRGSKPMFPWSTFSNPQFLARMPVRDLAVSVPAGPKGVYRIMLVGTRDHYATIEVGLDQPVAASGNHTWLHGSGDMFRKSYIYVPKKSDRLHLAIMEMDPPQTRQFKLVGPDGTVLYDGDCTPGFQTKTIAFPKDGSYDDKLLVMEVSAGPGDFMLHGTFNFTYQQLQRPTGGPARGNCQMTLAPDPKTARLVQGGVIYHDGETFFHPFQVRFHDWLKTLGPDDFVVRDDAGKEIKLTRAGQVYGRANRPPLGYHELAAKPGFVTLNGVHEAPPFSDRLMHSYSLHKNRAILNVALRDLHFGFMRVATGDYRGGSAYTNLGYMFGTYSFQWWRPAMRVLHETGAPAAVKAILHEALILGGDRLGFGTGIERVNGNAFSHVVIGLKYCAAATQDPLQLQRYKTFFDRFATEQWGVGVGISRSGDCQEHFAHDNHYGSYILANLRAPIADFADSEFKPLHDKIRRLYSYIWCPYGNANPWSSRTAHSLSKKAWSLGELAWMGEPGDDFTESVNDGDEWFAARRKNYYAVSFHGRLAPMWLVNGFYGQIGFSGGVLCQLNVPGKGNVFHSRLKPGGYGKGMGLEKWRAFELHSVVGTMADGRPFVGAVSEHLNATLTDNVVESSGEVRDRPVRITRRYTYNADHIRVDAQLHQSGFTPLLTLWSKGREKRIGTMTEAWEMIPFPAAAGGKVANVLLLDAAGKRIDTLSDALVTGVTTIDVQHDGYGAKLQFANPVAVKKAEQHAILIQLISKPTMADQISVSYRIVPYGN